MYLSVPEVSAEVIALCTKLKGDNLMHGAGNDLVEGVFAVQQQSRYVSKVLRSNYEWYIRGRVCMVGAEVRF